MIPKVRIKTMVCICMSMIMGLTIFPASAQAAVKYLPDVTSDMSNYEYWASKVSNPDEVLVDQQQIQTMNSRLCAKGAPMWDFPNWQDGTFNGVTVSNDLINSTESDLKYNFNNNWTRYDQEGNYYSSVDEWIKNYQFVIDNAADPNATENMPYRYGVCVNRTCLQSMPADVKLLDDATDPDFDYLYLTGMKVNEPVVIRTTSADGKYYSVYSASTNGWIPAKDVAICKDMDEWKAAWNMPSEKTLVICDDYVITENSNSTPETANRKIPMGSWLRLADESEWTGLISNRSAHNNHVVWLPIRNEDGSFSEKLALIGENRYVSEGYLPLTYRNITKVALRWVGNCYGWGGMLSSEDCSGYNRDVYRCFGMNMTRSARERDVNYMKYFNLKEMSDAEKVELIKTLPPGAILCFNGHQMMYLGHEGDKLYVISEISSIVLDGSTARIRNCVISTLDIKRRSGNTWLQELILAEIPYYDPDQQWPIETPIVTPDAPVITSSISVAKSTVKISWKAVENADSYQLQYRKAGASKWNSKTVAGKTAYTVAALTKGNIYQFRMKACADNKGNPTYSKSSNMVRCYIKGMSGFKATAQKKAMKLTWNKDAKATGYQIQYSRNKNMTSSKTITITKRATISRVVKNLKRGKTYYVKMRPVKKYNGYTYNGMWSIVKAVKVK